MGAAGSVHHVGGERQTNHVQAGKSGSLCNGGPSRLTLHAFGSRKFLPSGPGVLLLNSVISYFIFYITRLVSQWMPPASFGVF